MTVQSHPAPETELIERRSQQRMSTIIGGLALGHHLVLHWMPVSRFTNCNEGPLILYIEMGSIGKNHFSISWRATRIKRVVVILRFCGLVNKRIACLRVVK